MNRVRWTAFTVKISGTAARVYIETSRTDNYTFWTSQYYTQESSNARTIPICFTYNFLSFLIEKAQSDWFLTPQSHIANRLPFSAMLVTSIFFKPFFLVWSFSHYLSITHINCARMRINFFCSIISSQDMLSNWSKWSALFQTNRNAFSSSDKISIRN